MAKSNGAEKKEPWYGKTCVKCDAPINYAFAAKGPLPGYCGKCTDEARRLFQGEVQQPSKVSRIRPVFFERPAKTGVSVLVGLVLGLLIGICGSLALAALDPPRFEYWLGHAKKMLGK